MLVFVHTKYLDNFGKYLITQTNDQHREMNGFIATLQDKFTWI